MTMTLKTQAVKKAETTLTKHAIDMINSLGGPQIGTADSMAHLQVSLENHSAAQIPVWSLNVLEQTIKRQGIKSASPKANRYATAV